MMLGQVIAEAWLKLWETAVSHIPLPRGLADFTVALTISFILILVYRFNRRLCYVALISMTGAVLLSTMLLYTSPL